ncbi:MAG: hypothetical protein KKE84_04085 [Gammaproteobacteria bacterium]|nr:hypothetical protein [Gammaproteobacteria bacterium]
MKTRPWLQRALVGAMAAAMVLSVASDEGQQTGPPPAQSGEPPQRLAMRQPEPTSPALRLRVELERLSRSDAEAAAATGNLFGAISWYVPPPPPPPAPPRYVPPPPPTAPPMPFSFFGRYEEGETQIILLVRGDRIYTVSAGDVIDNTYRVEGLAGGSLELTYLPLNIKQTISTGERS